MTRPSLRILTLTTLYPNAAQPTHGVFVENRMRDYASRTGDLVRVVAPVPWFPISARLFGRYGAFARAPSSEVRHGADIDHPRYAIPPKIGMTYAAGAMARCFEKSARAMIAAGERFDVIDAHYLYPDGVAAVQAARRLGLPVVITARGSDVSQIAGFPRQRRMIIDAIMKADKTICVAQALKDRLVELGAPGDKIEVARNGVDLGLFRPLDRDRLRRDMSLQGPTIASVGSLIDRKGHHLVIEAMTASPDATLIIAGDGPDKAKLQNLAKALGVDDRVRFLGAVAHEALPEVYNAADLLVLASSREGWPNVLLEAMACGTPAVATDVWGNREVIGDDAAGDLLAARNADAIARAVNERLARPGERRATRAYAEAFSWAETSQKLKRIFDTAVAGDRAKRRTTIAPVNVADKRPELIITVDTEEIFDWSGPRATPRLSPVGDLSLFQALCKEKRVKPLYFLTYPLIIDADTSRYFRMLFQAGDADLGLHPHAWVNPPVEESDHGFNSWQCNLPLDLQERKLSALAEVFERTFGFRARTHRAGRYGVDTQSYDPLAKVGVEIDFSPSPGFDFSDQGGPDFSMTAPQPFRVETENGTIAVFPVSGARAFRKIRHFLKSSAAPGLDERERLPFLARRLTAPLRLTCEGADRGDVEALARHLARTGAPLMSFSLHSSSLTPGGSPYSPDGAAVDGHLAFVGAFIDFFRSELGGATISLGDLEKRLTTAKRRAPGR